MASDIKLTKFSKKAGCAAKLPPMILSDILDTLPKFSDKNLMVGFETSDDAAIYKINDEVALIQTLDFFPAMVDDPYMFGQVAAANAMSDVWAMGGEPKVALNIVCFPLTLDRGVLGDILRGGADKVKEAGAVLVGGHSVQDEEPKYGLSVSGVVHPDRVFKNYGCHPGDALVLTKQIGSGIVNTAVKAEMASESAVNEVQMVMSSLNGTAKRVAEAYDISACTDVTGFGLMGHCTEMASASGVSFHINVHDVAYLDDAPSCAKMGLIPSGAYRNRDFARAGLDDGGVEEVYVDLLHDPQTSGGLLLALPQEQVPALVRDLHAQGLPTEVSVIGYVTEQDEKLIHLHG